MGFQSPSTTHVPDALFDFWLSRLTGGELRVLLYATRRIFGHHAPGIDHDDIALDQFATGVVDSAGVRIDAGCGIRSRSTLLLSLRGVVEKGLLEKTPRLDAGGGHRTTTYRLVIDNPRRPARTGLSRPTTTQVPNELFDYWLPVLGDAELRALLYIVRRTLGFRRRDDQIGPHQFVDGISGRDGTVFDEGCGLSQKHLYRALKELSAHCLIAIDRHRDGPTGNVASTFALLFDDEEPWVIAARDPREGAETPRPAGEDAIAARAPSRALDRKGPKGGAITTDRGGNGIENGGRKGPRGGAITTDRGSDSVSLPSVSESLPRITATKGNQQTVSQQKDNQQQHPRVRPRADVGGDAIHAPDEACVVVPVMDKGAVSRDNETEPGASPPLRAARAALVAWGVTEGPLLDELAADPAEVLAQVARLDEECMRGVVKNPAGWLVTAIRARYRSGAAADTPAVNHDANSLSVSSRPPTDHMPVDEWGRLCAEVRSQMTPENYARWFSRPYQIGYVAGETLTIAVPDQNDRQWLDRRLRQVIDRCAARVLPARTLIVFTDDITDLDGKDVPRSGSPQAGGVAVT